MGVVLVAMMVVSSFRVQHLVLLMVRVWTHVQGSRDRGVTRIWGCRL